MDKFLEEIIKKLEEESYIIYLDGYINSTEVRIIEFVDAQKIINQFAEEHNNGWIACSERLPEKRDWYLAVFQEVDTGFIGLPFIADYLMGKHTNYTTEDGWIIANCTDIEEDRAEYYKKLKCIAWKPIAPYQPKGE